MPARVSVSMRSFLWTQTAGMCTPGVSVSETEGARTPVPAAMRSLSDFLSLSSYFLKEESHSLFLLLPTVVCGYPEIWVKHSLIWSIFLSHQVPSPLGREGLRS